MTDAGMKRRKFTLMAYALLTFGAGTTPGKLVAAAQCTLAVTHVSAVPMDAEHVLRDRTIQIAGDRILSVTASSRSRPRCTRTINGRGLYAMPGLNDMHIHVESSTFAQALHVAANPVSFQDVLYPYLYHGITGVRIMSGAPDILAFRNSNHGPTPQILVASPMLSGSPPAMPEPITRILRKPEEAIAAVNAYADQGYDFIKVRGNLTLAVLRAVIDTANARRLDVDGHFSRDRNPFTTGQRGVAHIDELSLLVVSKRFTPEEIVKHMLACGCYVTSTLTVEQSAAAQLRDYDKLAKRPENRFVHPMLRRALWARERNPYLAEAQNPAFFDRLLEIDRQLVRALSKAGVPIMVGTDALIPMIIPGDSLHDELALLIDAGLSPYQALSAATRTPARLFPKFRNLGELLAGKTANLILVAHNPLVDISSLRRPEAVIVGGLYFNRAALDMRMESIASGYEAK